MKTSSKENFAAHFYRNTSNGSIYSSYCDRIRIAMLSMRKLFRRSSTKQAEPPRSALKKSAQHPIEAKRVTFAEEKSLVYVDSASCLFIKAKQNHEYHNLKFIVNFASTFQKSRCSIYPPTHDIIHIIKKNQRYIRNIAGAISTMDRYQFVLTPKVISLMTKYGHCAEKICNGMIEFKNNNAENSLNSEETLIALITKIADIRTREEKGMPREKLNPPNYNISFTDELHINNPKSRKTL